LYPSNTGSVSVTVRVERLQRALVEGTELKIHGGVSMNKKGTNEILDPGGIEMPELA
jgi:hypothetical protein